MRRCGKLIEVDPCECSCTLTFLELGRSKKIGEEYPAYIIILI